ncbi:restriction endonuclease subunit M [Microbacterium sp. NPDC060132]|uniref:restriction endonuclease subunit M n=1 Tax=unclassified Microbacterium TaxID=2609290 RepID=UPI003651395B
MPETARLTNQGGDLVQLAAKDGYLRFEGEGRTQRVTYVHSGASEIYGDPEERVRASMYAELVYVYGYEASAIGVEVAIPDRVPNDRADLVVFTDSTRKRPFAVVECKREGISDAEFSQAVEQVAGNGTWSKLRAEYVMVVAGNTRQVLDFSDRYGVFERNDNIVADLPRRYGRPEEYKYRLGGDLDLRAVDKEQLIQALKKCHQSLWGGGRLSPPAAFGELSKLIFVKVSDEKQLRKVGAPYEFQIRTHESSARLADRIRALYQQHRDRSPDVFDEELKVDSNTLRTVVSHLEWISLSATDLDVKGLAFETFMDGFFKGDFGQYFTPREVIDFAIKMVRPSHEDVILDPACGSGGFLLHAMSAVMSEADEYYDRGTPAHTNHWRDFARQNLFGIEINDAIARVAKMNMIIHEDGHTNIVCEDALAPIEWTTQHNPKFGAGKFTLVLSNPPFGAQILSTQSPWLETYDLAKVGGRPRKAQKTEILFIERIAQYLAADGRAVIIVPDGILANASLRYVREYLLDSFQVLAVVSLPTSAFSHFGTTVKSSILILRRRGSGEAPDADEEVFMAAAESVGYDNTGRSAPNDLPAILAAYEEFCGR